MDEGPAAGALRHVRRPRSWLTIANAVQPPPVNLPSSRRSARASSTRSRGCRNCAMISERPCVRNSRRLSSLHGRLDIDLQPVRRKRCSCLLAPVIDAADGERRRRQIDRLLLVAGLEVPAQGDVQEQDLRADERGDRPRAQQGEGQSDAAPGDGDHQDQRSHGRQAGAAMRPQHRTVNDAGGRARAQPLAPSDENDTQNEMYQPLLIHPTATRTDWWQASR